MSDKLLKIKDLHTTVEDKEILKGLNLEINKGEIHVIMGPNGAGKSTLANTIMGHPRYNVVSGNIDFENEDIKELKTNERAKKGIFLSFQHPEEVPGINVENFIRTAKSAIDEKPVSMLTFNMKLQKKLDALKMDKSYAERYLNVGFSGGEKKKNEILQMILLEPKLAILDETDSGLDVDAVKIVSQGVNMYKNDTNSILIITHNTKILEHLTPNFVHVLIDGKIVHTGDASLADEINTNGYERFLNDNLK
ncbi:Fe-S cluster assembly ATP-binding protein [Clostridium cavendishii DSM 21758]|uniref:Fe-S cluster assembly ATP-binding protein n=1 Tax=Clostridium cavendishii DSM 21758 TaxID=1121302 RepID=A0A1M6AC41_9CLOT|nr:Fe-S cluster assembly ATPase SufC [Clostridium cavendishii]SHI34080.1 Fe-S cluster assembly ATP-binding protein [Clostridium cavendishii DSM 21758]